MMATPTTLKKTPLHSAHQSLGGKLVEFGGWDMPLQFGKVLEEHHAVRRAAGLFDICHMGILSVHCGDTAQTLSAINHVIPQDLTRIYAGKAVYTQLLTPEGGIIDDIIVYWLPETPDFPKLKEFMVICNASNTEAVLSWLRDKLPASCQIDYLNSDYSLIALQGPRFKAVLDAAGLLSSQTLPKRFHLTPAQLGEFSVLLSRTGYTGEDGVEVIVAASQVEALWHHLLSVGAPLGLLPIGLAARDTLRLEAAYPLHGHELSVDITPLEAGLGWSVKLDQADDFIGKSALLAQQAAGLTRHFVCFKALKRAIPRPHDVLYDGDGNRVGEVTSGSISPTLNLPIGVGYIQSPTPPSPGCHYQVDIRGTRVDIEIVERPFYKP